jgi:RNA polymerase sigma-70 factor (ECF subfamily)
VGEGERAEGIDVEAYYTQFGPMVLRRCRTLLRDEQRALDAMQDTFVNLLRNQHRLKGDAPSSLLYRIATNVCLNKLRSKKRKPEDPDDELVLRIASADDPEARATARRFLDKVFAREKESTRTIAVLHLLDGMTLQEVADAVGMSVSGVRKRLRGLKAHVKELEELP